MRIPYRARRRGIAAPLTAEAPRAVAQRTPQPVFMELFAYDPAEPSQLLGKWLISGQLDSKLPPLRVGVVEDLGRVAVQDGDGLDSTNEAMLQARGYRKSGGGFSTSRASQKCQTKSAYVLARIVPAAPASRSAAPATLWPGCGWIRQPSRSEQRSPAGSRSPPP